MKGRLGTVPAEDAFDFWIPRLAGGKGLPSWAEKHGDSCSFWTFLSFKGGQGDLPGQENKKIFKRSQDLGSDTKNCSKISNSLNNKPKSGSYMETLQLSCQHLKCNSWKSPNDSSPWQPKTLDVTEITELWKVGASPCFSIFQCNFVTTPNMLQQQTQLCFLGVQTSASKKEHFQQKTLEHFSHESCPM